MGQAAVRPAREAVSRRVIAWTLAISVNGVLIFSLLLLPRQAGETRPLQIIDLVLVPPPVTPAEPEDLAEPPDAPPADDTPDAAVTEPDPAAMPESRGPSAEAVEDVADEDQDQEAPTGDTSQGEPVIGLPEYDTAAVRYSGGPGSTPNFLRDFFCLTSSDATREAGHCPDDPDPDGLSMLRYVSQANIEAGRRAAEGLGMSPEEIRALFEGEGLGLADLRGQSSLADTSQRTTSSSDEMRDSLPARVPDPVFGD